jgi:hypothetical protein
MAENKDKPKSDKTKTKVKGVDVSGYMPPGPVSPMPPMGPYPNCPDDHMKKDTLMMKLRALVGQQVTVYVMGMGPAAAIQALPTAAPVVPSAGTMGLTGMLHHVGDDYLEMHVMVGEVMRVVYVPFMALASLVPGGPLLYNMTPNTVTTIPESTL